MKKRKHYQRERTIKEREVCEMYYSLLVKIVCFFVILGFNAGPFLFLRKKYFTYICPLNAESTQNIVLRRMEKTLIIKPVMIKDSVALIC